MKFIQEICKNENAHAFASVWMRRHFCGCHMTRQVLICNSSASIKFYNKKQTNKHNKKKEKKTMNK